MWHRGCLKDSGYFGLDSGGSISVIILKISWQKLQGYKERVLKVATTRNTTPTLNLKLFV